MLIDVNHLKLTLDGRNILKDVSLHLESGEIYGLLGPNGAGKSTTIAALLGLYKADSGAIAMLDQTVGKHPEQIRSRIGVLPERAGFYHWMTVKNYLAWYAGFYGGLQQPLHLLLKQVGLDNASNHLIGQFSRGMLQRLGLARALLHGPELLILDEPTNGLDPRGRREIHDLLLDLAREQHVGILLCTHLLDDVDRLCTRIGIIDKGCTVLEGSLPELLGQRQVGRRYRLRLESFPTNPGKFPSDVSLVRQEGDWWYFVVEAENAQFLPDIWKRMLNQGWQIAEIHAEGRGLEELYLRLTTTTDEEAEAA